ncbi:MAG TPA: Asp-tRNA(Asn)/Glu-tRNA(Gln) amidotransferase subunit GatC [Candidatus Binatia bacterium]|nr:Asp-tRNA(Asn)/Glu-tRNA(Gln) amidotransferase subunit GatC [Candidatus Binatia bacterium]
MAITEKDVSYVADLANLDLTPHERALMLRDLNSILEYIQMLNELDTSNVPPMAQVTQINEAKGKKEENESLRDDIPEGLRPSLPQSVALENAPDSDGTFFRVPKVIER